MIKPGFTFISLFLMLFFVVAAIALLVVLVTRSKRTPPPVGGLSQNDRIQTLQRKQDRYEEERGRILAMVAEGKLSPDDADRLFVSLERETTTMSCPYCAEEIRVEAAKCKHCHQYLVDHPNQQKRLTKSSDRVLSGVCGGLAEHLNLDPTLIRVLTALVVVFSGIITGLIVYVIAACIMPEPTTVATTA